MLDWLAGAGVVFWVCVAGVGWLLLMLMTVLFFRVGAEADDAYRELRMRDLEESRARRPHVTGSSVKRIPIEDEVS